MEPEMSQDDFFRLLGQTVAELDYWKRRALAAEKQREASA